MELLQVMKNRRSVRKYTGDKVPQDKLDLILQAGLLAPIPAALHVLQRCSRWISFSWS